MYNRTTVQQLGLCQLELCNTKNGKVYQVEFTFLRQDYTRLLGSETTQEIDLIQVLFENILSLDRSSKGKPLTKEPLIAKFPDVFNGTGKLHEPYHLEIEADAIPVVHPPRKVPIAIKHQFKENPLPTIEDILPDLSRAKVFSTFDVKNGFWHIELDEESSKLTTFNTPFGRYRWLRLPFGLSSAPEEFQRRQHQVIERSPQSVVDTRRYSGL